MTTGDEGDEHQMERQLQWEANAYKGQCNEQRGPKATLPELASMKKNSRLSLDRSGVPCTGVKILPKLWRRSGCEGEATMIQGDPNAHAPSCPIHHVEKRSRHREGHLDGKGPKLKANEAEGPGATSKLQEGQNWAPGGQI